MKNIKKLLSVLICFVMVFSALPITNSLTASAATSGKTGACTWKLDGTVLTISGNGAMGNYTDYPGPPWDSSITEVVINYGVTSIGNCAFIFSTQLTSITIPNSVTSIGSGAFEQCWNLTSITIPNSVTTIGSGAFCASSLTDITIPDSVTSIGKSIFWQCTYLKKISLPFLGSTVNDTENAYLGYFYGAKNYSENNTEVPKSLEEVIITKAGSIADYAFYNCDSLKSVSIPQTVTSIGKNSFLNCNSIENIHYNQTLEKWEKIEIQTGNEPLSNATIYYNSNGTIGDITSVNILKCPSKHSYIMNEESLSLMDGFLAVNYDSGVYKLVDLTTLTAEGFDNTKLGKQTITVKYGKFTTSFEIEIISKPIAFIVVAQKPLKSIYIEGTDLDLTGGRIVVAYMDGIYELVDINNTQILGYDKNKIGLQAITVNYQGFTAEFTVTVTEQQSGDVDKNTVINILDIIALRNALLSKELEYQKCYDVNEDGNINSLDVTALRKKLFESF